MHKIASNQVILVPALVELYSSSCEVNLGFQHQHMYKASVLTRSILGRRLSTSTQRNSLDLDRHTLRQLLHGHTGAGGLVREVRLVHLVLQTNTVDQ